MSDVYQMSDIPTRIIKEILDVLPTPVYCLILLTTQDINLIFSKESGNDKTSYRPVSVLRNSSKFFEKILCKQI